MKLIKVKIHGFRGIVEQDFVLKDYSLLVGPNNAGKSSVVDAIRAFYEKDGFKFKKENDTPFMQCNDQESWIDLTFELNSSEYDSLADDYKASDNHLVVRKFFNTVTKTSDGKSAAGLIFGFLSDGTLSNQPFYGAKNVQSGKFGDLIYVPAISRVDEYAKLSGPSALRDLLTDIMGDVIAGGKAYGGFSESVRVFSEAIRDEKTEDHRSLAGLEAELNTLLKPWESEFKLKFPPPSASDIIKSMLGWDLIDRFHEKPQSIEYFGSGFQRHFIYSLIQLGARYIAKKPVKRGKDFSPSMNLVLFEEPEAFLHPPQQEILTRNLVEMSSSGNWQVICTTHSPHFVSKNTLDIPAIIRLKRDSGVVRKYQIDPTAWAAIVNSSQAINAIAQQYPKMAKKLHEDDAKPEMEAIKHSLWLNPDRSNLFFASCVLLVEGPTEVALINRLIGDSRIQNTKCGLYVLDCLGKYNIHRFMALLTHLGVPHSVIHDDDNGKDEHADINMLIDASKHPDFTLCVNAIPGELETMLGIPSAKSDHRKPQHVLYQYETGQINPKKLQDFCSLVDSCLPRSV